MAAGSIELSQGVGAHKVKFLDPVNAGDELALKASTRQCLKNGSPTRKDGFYQYSAAWDSKHTVKLEERKSARVLFEFQEMQEGGDRL
jgi:acyl dehydratase